MRLLAVLLVLAVPFVSLAQETRPDTAGPSAPAPAPGAPAEPKQPGAAPANDLEAARSADIAREMAARRARLAALGGPDAVVLVLSPSAADGVPGTGRNTDFEYVSPVTAREGAVVVAIASGKGGPGSEAVDRLYVPVRNPAAERWTGPETGPGPATAAAAGFREARAMEQLLDDLVPLVRARGTVYVSARPSAAAAPGLARLVAGLRERLAGRWIRLADLPGAGKDDVVESLRRALPARTPESESATAISKLPATDLRPAGELFAELREVKSAAEVARIRRAVDATVLGHADAIRTARAGLFEFHLQAVFELRCRVGGCRRQAYPTIAASGPNSCVLHYDRNRRRLEDGDLVVLDAGGEFEGYACDVTRTFPVSGRFTDEQAKVYDAVLEAQVAAVAAVRPGVTLKHVHEAARAVLEKHGLAKWFLHGTCHSVGLDVHDPWRKDALLRPGCVITVEPGVYDASRNLGVRIEDIVLVTETGCEVLSAGLPKSRVEVERLAAEDPPAGLLR